MSGAEDPGLWKTVSGWLWALLAVPLAALWRKADRAVSKDDLREHLDEDREVHKEFRDTMRDLYRNAEADRKMFGESLSALRNDMHALHVELLDRMK